MPPPRIWRWAADRAPYRRHSSSSTRRIRGGTCALLPTPSPALYALDTAPAEDPFRPDHQHQDHQHIGRKILCAAPDDRVEIPGSKILDDADDEPADNRAHDRVEPAQDHNRKDLEADEGQLVVDTQHRAPDDAAERRDDAGHRPGQRKVAPHINPHRHRPLLAVGYGAHRDARAAL